MDLAIKHQWFKADKGMEAAQILALISSLQQQAHDSSPPVLKALKTETGFNCSLDRIIIFSFWFAKKTLIENQTYFFFYQEVASSSTCGHSPKYTW